jgi:hypothetical protein
MKGAGILLALALAGCAAGATAASGPAPSPDGSDHVDRLRVDGPWRPGPRGEEVFSVVISYPRAPGLACEWSDAWFWYDRPSWGCSWNRPVIGCFSWRDLPRTCH